MESANSQEKVTEELYEGVRGKGFLSLENPFVLADDTQVQRVYITPVNYKEFMETAEDRKVLNEFGVPPYCLSFYELQDGETEGERCDLFSDTMNSSLENQISPLEWPQFAACTRISKTRYIITGGINLQAEYQETFAKKFKLVMERQKEDAPFHAVIARLESLKSANWKGDEEDRKQNLLSIIVNAQKLSHSEDEFPFAKEPDMEKRIVILQNFYQSTIENRPSKDGMILSRLDIKFCKEQNITYAYSPDLDEDEQVFNKSTPYLDTAIEVALHFDIESGKYLFTGKYLKGFMPLARSNHQAVVHQGALYVLGGVLKQKALNSVCKLDLLSLQWSEFTPMITPKVHFSAVSHKEHIYILGGYTTCFNESSWDWSTLDRIDPTVTPAVWESFKWKKVLSSKSEGVFEHQMRLFSWQDSLLLFGGFSNPSKIEEANKRGETFISQVELLAKNTWNTTVTETAICTRNRGGIIASGYYQDKQTIFIFGGMQKVTLECLRIEEQQPLAKGKSKLPNITRIIENDYTDEIREYTTDFFFAQPTLFID